MFNELVESGEGEWKVERKMKGRGNHARGGIRTHDLCLRRAALYPAELLAPFSNRTSESEYPAGAVAFVVMRTRKVPVMPRTDKDFC